MAFALAWAGTVAAFVAAVTLGVIIVRLAQGWIDTFGMVPVGIAASAVLIVGFFTATLAWASVEK